MASCPIPRTSAMPSAGGTSSARSNTCGSTPAMPLAEVAIDRVFIGSCTNSRIEDLRAGGASAEGPQRGGAWHGLARLERGEASGGIRRARSHLPGRRSGVAGFRMLDVQRLERRDRQPGERCASTTNRNFEGRQGRGAMTHIMSPAMVAAAAVHGRLADVRRLEPVRAIDAAVHGPDVGCGAAGNCRRSIPA